MYTQDGADKADLGVFLFFFLRKSGEGILWQDKHTIPALAVIKRTIVTTPLICFL